MMGMKSLSWSENLRAEKVRAEYTQETLAFKSGISRDRLAKMLTGRTRDLDVLDLARLCDALGCAAWDIVPQLRPQDMEERVQREAEYLVVETVRHVGERLRGTL